MQEEVAGSEEGEDLEAVEVGVGVVGAVDGQEAAGGAGVLGIPFLEDQGPTSTEDQVIYQGGIQWIPMDLDLVSVSISGLIKSILTKKKAQ